MYWSHQLVSGRPPARKKNLQDLLRLTLGAVELASTRREAVGAVPAGGSPTWLPGSLTEYKHAVYETSVVYEFSQLAQHDFRAHGNDAVWERPLAYLPSGAQYWRRAHIDMALFSQARKVETRIEFGKSSPNTRRLTATRDLKLEEDAHKLHEAREAHRAHKSDSDPEEDRKLTIENFVVLWDERDSRDRSDAKLTRARAEAWRKRCLTHAGSATEKLGFAVELEAVAASSLMTLENDAHRTAYAAIYCIA